LSTGLKSVLGGGPFARTFSAEEVDSMTIHNDESTERARSNDPLLTTLTTGQAAQLIRLAVAAAAERGLLAEYDGAGALTLRPRSGAFNSGFTPTLAAGLTNLARIVSGYPLRDWPELVAGHFDQLGDSLLHGPPPPPTDPHADLLLRLTPAASLPPDWATTAPEFVPGLLAVPATYDQGIVTMHLDPADFGMTRPEAEQAGLANLRRLTDELEYVGHGGAQVAVLSGSTFTASRALVLDTVLRESLHVENPQYGVLAAMPVRDRLILHVVKDLSVIPALALMLSLTLRAHLERPGPLSPWIYLVTDNTWRPATTQPTTLRDIHLSPETLALAHTLQQFE